MHGLAYHIYVCVRARVHVLLTLKHWLSFSTAVLFFAISSFFELLCVILYAFAFPKLPIVKYYRSRAASEGSKTVSADLAAGGIQTLPEAVCHSLQRMLK